MDKLKEKLNWTLLTGLYIYSHSDSPWSTIYYASENWLDKTVEFQACTFQTHNPGLAS